jgi:hypothetical protein
MLRLLLALDSVKNLSAVNYNSFRRTDADAYLVAPHRKDGNGDVVSDHQRLTYSSGQYQHGGSSTLMDATGSKGTNGAFTEQRAFHGSFAGY